MRACSQPKSACSSGTSAAGRRRRGAAAARLPRRRRHSAHCPRRGGHRLWPCRRGPGGVPGSAGGAALQNAQRVRPVVPVPDSVRHRWVRHRPAPPRPAPLSHTCAWHACMPACAWHACFHGPLQTWGGCLQRAASQGGRVGWGRRERHGWGQAGPNPRASGDHLAGLTLTFVYLYFEEATVAWVCMLVEVGECRCGVSVCQLKTPRCCGPALCQRAGATASLPLLQRAVASWLGLQVGESMGVGAA